MKRLILLSLAALPLLLPATGWAGQNLAPLEAVAAGYARIQPTLTNYQVTLATDKMEEMITRMTASMPPDTPRPLPPMIRKYWSRAQDRSLIRAEGSNSFPYMQEMVARFSREFAVDLPTLFLPLRAAAERAQLVKNASVKVAETHLGESRRLKVDIVFAAPTDLHQAFFQEGLKLPQTAVTALSFDLDAGNQILHRLSITTQQTQLTVELRHQPSAGGYLATEIGVTAPDGSIDDRFVTTLQEVDGFQLPSKQVRTSRRQGKDEIFEVSFSGYRINQPFPADVAAALGTP